MTTALSSFLTRFTDNAYLQAGIVILAAFVVALIVNALVRTVVLPLLGRFTKTTFDDEVVGLLHGPMIKSIMLIGLGIATGLLRLTDENTTQTIRVLWTIGILVWASFSFKLSHKLLHLAKGQTDKFIAVEGRTFPLFDNTGKVLIFGIATYLVIYAWDVDATGWVASAGIVGLALSFAAQDSLSNLFAGVFIIADAPYKVGDFINLESGERGQVSHIGLRSTRLLTRDDIEVTIPNSVMGKARIVNESAGACPKHRVRIKVGVAYGSDVDKVREVLLEASQNEEDVCHDPEPRVRFRAFGDSSLDFELLVWIPTPILRGQVIDTLNTKIYKLFAKNGIEIPFPQRDVHIKQMPGTG
jgi:MscS family membrane protein